MKRLALVLILLIGPIGCVRWSKADTAMEVGAVVLLAADWHQTNSITATCTEANPIIGECGQNVPPVVWFPEVILLHAFIAALLPRDYRTMWQGAMIGAEASTVWSNYRDGVR